MKKLFILVFIPLAIVLAACTQQKESNQETLEINDNDQIFCAQDAKECPDGTFVGRDPKNNCEFEPCP